MTEPRYQTLLGRVLDDEVSSVELEEFATALQAEPRRVADFQFHLVLWELLSQQRRPERTAEAFLAAWSTRLVAEATRAAFVDQSVERIQAVESTQPDAQQEGKKARAPIDLAPRESPGREAHRASRPDFADLLRFAIMRHWGRVLALATCVVLAIGLSAWYLGPTMGEPVLAEVQGSGLVLERAGQVLAATKGMRLQPGDALRTSGSTTGALSYAPERTRLLIHPGTDLKLSGRSHSKHFLLGAGKIEAAVARQRPFHAMSLLTPQAEARVLGTRFALSVSANATRLEVTEGIVRFTRLSDRSSIKVPAGSYAVAGSNVVLAPLPFTGSIYQEYWTNIPGPHWTALLSHSNYPNLPDVWSLTNLATLEMASTGATNYGQRLRGYLHPPKTGNYTFWIAAKKSASLYLSPDESPKHKVHMVNAELGPKMSGVPLTAGRKYYFEVVHKVAEDGGRVAVDWQQPGGERETIAGEFLSPFDPGKKK